ncbi:MAG: class I SAM-dependent methyltransferase [Actinomycetota bacterium]|nr:class I SAM-dependent methyltransferase [Actinomycetota bacterium]
MDVIEFVRSQLPGPPARILEIGCGEGELARALADAGWDVLAIDPAAPDGPIFRRLKLEDVDEPESFDAVVAARSLHHVTDLEAGLDRVRDLLRPRGVLVLDEFAWDRLDRATADWFHGQQRALMAAGRLPEAPATIDDCCREWQAEHVGLHGYEAMRAALHERFRERSFEWMPYLYRYLGGVAGEELERTLIEAGAIQATGFRYVGVK